MRGVLFIHGKSTYCRQSTVSNGEEPIPTFSANVISPEPSLSPTSTHRLRVSTPQKEQRKAKENRTKVGLVGIVDQRNADGLDILVS